MQLSQLLPILGRKMEPEFKTVIVPIWDLENNEMIEMEIGEDFLGETDRLEQERKERQKEVRRREREWSQYDRT
jgi:hypothetical protein